MAANTDKEVYEALQALNSYLTEMEEQLLVDLVEKIREGYRSEARQESWKGMTEATLKRWIEFDAAEKVAGTPTG
jgi:hypothetical protein